MSQSILFDKTKIVDNTNTTLRHNFPTTLVIDDENTQMALSSITMYNSIYNINANLYNNNTFSYCFFDNTSTGQTTTTQFKVTLADGYYTTNDINEAFMAQMVANKHYVQSKTDATKRTFFISFKDNTVAYRVQAYFSVCPTTADLSNNGWDLPIGATWKANASVISSKTPTVIFPTTSAFNKILGFSQGTYPALNTKNTAYTILGDLIPEQVPASSIIIQCNMVRNDYTVPDNCLYSFQFIGDSFGQLNSERPNELIWMRVKQGSYSSIELRMLDQNYGRLHILDPQMLINVLLRKK